MNIDAPIAGARECSRNRRRSRHQKRRCWSSLGLERERTGVREGSPPYSRWRESAILSAARERYRRRCDEAGDRLSVSARHHFQARATVTIATVGCHPTRYCHVRYLVHPRHLIAALRRQQPASVTIHQLEVTRSRIDQPAASGLQFLRKRGRRRSQQQQRCDCGERHQRRRRTGHAHHAPWLMPAHWFVIRRPP